MSALSQFLGGGSSGGLSYSLVYTATPGSPWAAPFNCNVTVLIQGAGGSGASNVNATGGNSGPWGVKQLTLSAGETLLPTIGAGGAGVTGGVNGNPGGTTSVSRNGAAAFISAAGGEGGTGNAGAATLAAPTVAAAITGADVWYPGLQAGAVTAAVSAARTGGAAVNVTGDGMGRSPSANVGSVITAGGSVGRSPVINATVALDPLNTLNFLTFGVFPIATTGKGSDSSAAPAASASLFGGGGSSSTGSAGQAGGQGGFGAGGGACTIPATSGAGGSGYVCLLITKI